MGPAVRLLERRPMRAQRQNAAFRPKDLRRDRLPERRTADLLIEDVMDGHGLPGDGPPRVDQAGSPCVDQAPEAVVPLLDILPADLANVVRAVSGCCQVDDADARAGFGHQTWATSTGYLCSRAD